MKIILLVILVVAIGVSLAAYREVHKTNNVLREINGQKPTRWWNP